MLNDMFLFWLKKPTFSLMPNCVTINLAIFVALSKSLDAPVRSAQRLYIYIYIKEMKIQEKLHFPINPT